MPLFRAVQLLNGCDNHLAFNPGKETTMLQHLRLAVTLWLRQILAVAKNPDQARGESDPAAKLRDPNHCFEPLPIGFEEIGKPPYG